MRTSTIQVYLSSINFFIKLLFGDSALSISHPHVNVYIKHLPKAEPQLAPKRIVLIADLLICCIQTLRTGYLSPSIDSTLEAMFLLAIHVFLQCSESPHPPTTHYSTQAS